MKVLDLAAKVLNVISQLQESMHVRLASID